jgi:hypothetical protein
MPKKGTSQASTAPAHEASDAPKAPIKAPKAPKASNGPKALNKASDKSTSQASTTHKASDAPKALNKASDNAPPSTKFVLPTFSSAKLMVEQLSVADPVILPVASSTHPSSVPDPSPEIFVSPNVTVAASAAAGQTIISLSAESASSTNDHGDQEHDDYGNNGNGDDDLSETIKPKVLYRPGTTENDQLALVYAAVTGNGPQKYRTQLWNLFFCYICAIIGGEITTKEQKGKLDELHMKAYALYVGIDKEKYVAILRSGVGLFAAVESKMPEYVLGQSLTFIVDTKKTEIEKGKHIWTTYQNAKTYVLNTANPLVRPIKSGENKTGVLLEIREVLWSIDFTRKRDTRLSREAAGKGLKGMFQSSI